MWQKDYAAMHAASLIYDKAPKQAWRQQKKKTAIAFDSSKYKYLIIGNWLLKKKGWEVIWLLFIRVQKLVNFCEMKPKNTGNEVAHNMQLNTVRGHSEGIVEEIDAQVSIKAIKINPSEKMARLLAVSSF